MKNLIDLYIEIPDKLKHTTYLYEKFIFIGYEKPNTYDHNAKYKWPIRSSLISISGDNILYWLYGEESYAHGENYWYSNKISVSHLASLIVHAMIRDHKCWSSQESKMVNTYIKKITSIINTYKHFKGEVNDKK